MTSFLFSVFMVAVMVLGALTNTGWEVPTFWYLAGAWTVFALHDLFDLLFLPRES